MATTKLKMKKTMTPDVNFAALREVVLRLATGIPDVPRSREVEAMLAEEGGWSVSSMLRTAAACAVVRELPSTDPDVLFVAAALKRHGFSLG